MNLIFGIFYCKLASKYHRKSLRRLQLNSGYLFTVCRPSAVCSRGMFPSTLRRRVTPSCPSWHAAWWWQPSRMRRTGPTALSRWVRAAVPPLVRFSVLLSLSVSIYFSRSLSFSISLSLLHLFLVVSLSLSLSLSLFVFLSLSFSPSLSPPLSPSFPLPPLSLPSSASLSLNLSISLSLSSSFSLSLSLMSLSRPWRCHFTDRILPDQLDDVFLFGPIIGSLVHWLALKKATWRCFWLPD